MREQPLRRVLALVAHDADRAAVRARAELRDAGRDVDGNDVAAVYEAVAAAVARARAGDGPTLIEALTYRHKGHSRSDPGAYRPEGEVEAWLARDPITLLEAALRERGVEQGLIDERRQAAEQNVRGGAGARPRLARAGSRVATGARLGMSVVTYSEAINRALADALEEDERVFLIGEDIAAAGGVFKAPRG